MPQKISDKISLQILRSVFKHYLIAAIIITVIQLVLEFNATKKELFEEMSTMKSSFYSSIQAAIFNYDDEQLSTICKGILENKSIVGVKVFDENKRLLAEAGDFKSVQSDFTTIFNVQKSIGTSNLTIGKVILYSSDQVVLKRIQYGFILIIVNSFFKTALLWFILIFFLHRYLSIPLTDITRKLNYSSSQTYTPIKLNYKYQNEFSAFIDVHNRLTKDFINLTKKVQNHNKTLEEQIKEKTKDLTRSNLEIHKMAQIKTNLLANMSHEIRTPLNGIIGLIASLKEQADQSNIELIQTIEGCSFHLLQVLNDVLDMSKLESDQFTLQNTVFNITTLINEVTNICKPIAKSKNIQFSSHIEPNIPESYHGDPTRLKQVILNVTSNAIKYTNDGYVKLTINFNQATKKFLLNVEDTGIGISQENIKQLFTEFFQVNSNAYGGTGLGLAISYNLVKKMGGDIQCTSALGVGTNFLLTIPLAPVLGIKIENKDETSKTFINFRKTILVAEDNQINQLVVKKILTSLSINHIIVDNGLQAIEKLRTNNEIALIFMDLRMPKLDGLKTTKKIKEEFPSPPPILALTANSLDEDRAAALKAGMVDFMTKPITKQKVLEAIANWGS